jgi:hypothetical protein
MCQKKSLLHLGVAGLPVGGGNMPLSISIAAWRSLPRFALKLLSTTFYL